MKWNYIRITYNDILNITTKGSVFIWVKGNSQSNRGIFNIMIWLQAKDLG